jgi:hypothetical protein
MLRRSQRLAGHLISSLNPPPAAKMSTRTFILPDTNVSVNLVGDISKEQLLELPAFKVNSVILPHFPKHTFTGIVLMKCRTGSKDSKQTSPSNSQTQTTNFTPLPTNFPRSRSNPSSAGAHASVSLNLSLQSQMPITRLSPVLYSSADPA